MALPSSGPISLADIQTEFGGSNPISLSEYYAGGAYVQAGATGTYGAVPSSGAISLRDFYGTSKTITRTVTVGIKSDPIVYLQGYGASTAPLGAYGSISDQAFGLTSATVVEITIVNSTNVLFRLAGSQPNSGFSKITIGTSDFLRTNASYTVDAGYTYWTWNGVSNPFPSAGSTVSVVYTP